MTAAPVRVAVDLLGGDHAPDLVVAGARRALAEDEALRVVLVGPPHLADDAVPIDGKAADGGDPASAARLSVVPATDAVSMGEHPVRAVRAKRNASVRVTARLVRDGAADAMVSVGSTGAAVTAAVLSLGRLRGMTRAALTVVVPALAHPVILLDAGANTDVSADALAEFAVVGAAFARTRLQLLEPRVGLLSIGSEVGKGDGLRRQAHASIASALEGTGVRFAGNVEGGDVPLGGPADVVVTDGFSGNVLLKAIEGTHRLLTRATDGAEPELQPERFGGGVLLGVRGVVVLGHGASGERAVASCVAMAAAAVRDRLVATVDAGLTELGRPRRAVWRSAGRSVVTRGRGGGGAG